mmetsp:Transcript_41116/g.121932  ORF Transcript_41116/g.121932 Transcript_41116/m.121932 type:complete len:175 (+) Transcript_41116:67-591(+)
MARKMIAAALLVVLAAASEPSYADQALDMKHVMEAGRKAPLIHQQALVKKSAKKAAVAIDAELDDRLFASADRVMKDLHSMEASKPKAALAAVKGESQQERAARYFAANGLDKMGSMLGLNVASAKARASQMVKKAELAKVEKAEVEIDDSEQAERARWKKVDALRLKRPASIK